MVRLPPYLKPQRGTWLNMRQYVSKGYWKVPYWMWTTARVPQPAPPIFGGRIRLPNFEYLTDHLLQKRMETTAFTDDPDFSAPIQMIPGDVDLVTHPDTDFVETQLKLIREGYSESEAYDLVEKRMEQDNEDKLVEQLVASEQAESMGIPLTGLFENISVYTTAYDEAFRKRAEFARKMRIHGLQMLLKEKIDNNDTTPLTPEEIHYVMPDFEEQYQFYHDYPSFSDLLPFPTTAPPEIFEDEPPEDVINFSEEKVEEIYREFKDHVDETTGMISQSDAHTDMNTIGDEQESEFVDSETTLFFRENSLQNVYEDALKMAKYRDHPRRDFVSWRDMKIEPELKIPEKVWEISKVNQEIYKENIVEETYDRLKLKEEGVTMKDLPHPLTGLPDENNKGEENLELAGHVLDPRGNVLMRLRLKLQDFGTKKTLKLGALNALKRRQEYESTGFVDEVEKEIVASRPNPLMKGFRFYEKHKIEEYNRKVFRKFALVDLLNREERYFGKRGPISPKDQELFEKEDEEDPEGQEGEGGENDGEMKNQLSEKEKLNQENALNNYSESGGKLKGEEESEGEGEEEGEGEGEEFDNEEESREESEKFDDEEESGFSLDPEAKSNQAFEQSFKILTDEEMKLKGEELDNYIKQVENTTYYDHFGISFPELPKDQRIRNEDGEIDPKLVLKEKIREKREQKEKAEAPKSLLEMNAPELFDEFYEKTEYNKTIFYPELNIANSYLPPLDPENIRKIEKAFKVGGPRAVEEILYQNDFIKSGLGPSAFADMLPQQEETIEDKDVEHLLPVDPGKPLPDMEKMRQKAEAATPHYFSPKEKQDFVLNESARMAGLDGERSSQLFRFQKAMKWFKKRKETEQRHHEEIPYEHYENMEEYPSIQAPYVNPFFKKGEEDFLKEKLPADKRIPYDGLFSNSKFREVPFPQAQAHTPTSDKPKKKK